MSLAQIYSQQYPWRRWSDTYSFLGDLTGKRVVDLGCGIGDQSRDLAERGAEVWGIDANQEAIDHARQRKLPHCRFFREPIGQLSGHGQKFDGVWASFTAAYFVEFSQFLSAIESSLTPGGWLALTEVDDLFGHAPMEERWRDLVERYYAVSLDQGVYRFQSLNHVRGVLQQRGWSCSVEKDLDDDEFCFEGAAKPKVWDAWKTRLGLMMPRFQERFGADATGFDTAFLECLTSAQHRSRARVWFLLARPPE